MKKIAIFASGSGSNAENIFNYFASKKEAKVVLILTNNKNAYVLSRAKKKNIPSIVFNKDQFENTDDVLTVLKENNINLIVLAGFLLKIPINLINEYPNNIINIHPALLPKFGGKGMYGDNVHKAVVANNELESGITIHYVNEHYDEGKIIFQKKFTVLSSDTFKDVASKVHELEYKHFPKIIENVLFS